MHVSPIHRARPVATAAPSPGAPAGGYGEPARAGQADRVIDAEMGNAVTVHAGETAELTWRFTRAGTVLLGCHVQGHYEAGIRGEVTVG